MIDLTAKQPEDRLLLADPERIEQIRVSIVGNQDTVLIEDFYPFDQRSATNGKSVVWLTVNEARGVRDWLNKVLP